jgi:uncharacterized protein YcaQ
VPRSIKPNSLPIVDAVTARRLLLHAQGLLSDPTQPATPARLHQLIQHMGFVQIDTINILERAHHLTLFSRLDQYRPRMLAELAEVDRTLFEHWTHDASIIPTQWFAHWKHRFDRYRKRDPHTGWWKTRLGPRPRKVIAEVLRRIEADGPVMSKDFEKPRGGSPGGPDIADKWWQWKPHKAALEHLWRCGEIAVAKRVNFHKVYDLTHRVLPRHHDLPAPETDAHVDWACRSALERLIIASPSEIAAFWNAVKLPPARRWCATAHKRGEIEHVLVASIDGGKPRLSFALPAWRDLATQLHASLEFSNGRIRLLSPFDPVLRDRKRASRLFNFDYRLEVFTPAPQRKYGYYVLPMLYGDRLIGRVEPIFKRDLGELVINGIWWESKVKRTTHLRAQLDAALQGLAHFVGASRIGHRTGRSALRRM